MTKHNRVKAPTPYDRQQQALHALNCAIGCMVAWPPSEEHLGAAVFFTALALHRMVQADPSGSATVFAEKHLEQARLTKTGVIHVPTKEVP
jgi:hypothetical protein